MCCTERRRRGGPTRDPCTRLRWSPASGALEGPAVVLFRELSALCISIIPKGSHSLEPRPGPCSFRMPHSIGFSFHLPEVSTERRKKKARFKWAHTAITGELTAVYPGWGRKGPVQNCSCGRACSAPRHDPPAAGPAEPVPFASGLSESVSYCPTVSYRRGERTQSPHFARPEACTIFKMQSGCKL